MTLFEKIIAREIPATIVHETDELIAIRDIQPQAPVHILIIPKKAFPGSNDLTSQDEQLIGRLVLAAAEIARKEEISESGYRLVLNCNEDGGQSVDHLHIHLLGGRKLSWPPG